MKQASTLTNLEYILGGGCISEFNRNELPTVGDVLRFYSQFWGRKQSDSSKETFVSNALEECYRSKKIATICKGNIRRKVKREVGKLSKILKFKTKSKTTKQIQMENEFRSTLSNVFPIEKISNGPSSDFDEPMEVDSLDNDTDEDCRFDQDTSHDYVVPSDDDDPSDDEFDYSKKKRDVPDDILWKMCMTGVSFNVLSQILKLSYSVLGESENFHLSTSHLFKRYQKLMETKETEYNCEIRERGSFGTICFDHHSMKQLSGKFIAKEDRLVVLWHSDFEDKLLSIDKIASKSGRNQSNSILRACENFNIRDHQIVAVTCDNENTNTGNAIGTCITIEMELLKDLLRAMCRHHIHEIDVKGVYKFLFPSEMPINLFHSILSEEWPVLKSNHFPFARFNAEDEEIMEFDGEQTVVFMDLRDRAILDLQGQSTNSSVRDDYQEITNVCLKFLTGESKILTKSNQVQFNALQNPSNARFMASSIQGLNCFLFRHHLDWNSPGREHILEQLPRFCLFLSLVYVRYWNRSNVLFDAGINDLNFLKELEEYGTIDRAVSDVAIETFSRHLYYLGEELIVLSLFSNRTSENEKHEMAERLLQFDVDIPERDFDANHIKFNGHIERWSDMRIVNFVGERSLHLFQLFDIPLNFLSTNAESWGENAEYLSAKNKIEAALICVNDGSERVISTCKSKCKKQRCKNDTSFRRSMLEKFMKN